MHYFSPINIRRTCIGIKVPEGIVLAVEKPLHSKLLVKGANRRIATIDKHVGMAGTGLVGDVRYVANSAREEATKHMQNFQYPITAKNLAMRVSLTVQAYTMYSSVRPLGATSIFGVHDENGSHLYMIEPSGAFWGYNACAAGRGVRNAKNELEKLNLASLSIIEAVKEAARIIYDVHNDAKDKEFELEMSWICKQSDWKHAFVPQELLSSAISHAESCLEEKMQE